MKRWSKFQGRRSHRSRIGVPARCHQEPPPDSVSWPCPAQGPAGHTDTVPKRPKGGQFREVSVYSNSLVSLVWILIIVKLSKSTHVSQGRVCRGTYRKFVRRLARRTTSPKTAERVLQWTTFCELTCTFYHANDNSII